MKAKKIVRGIVIALVVIILAVAIAAGVILHLYKANITADFSSTVPMTSGASGYLYGLAEDGVPSQNMVESVDVSTVSQKAPDGLQHPIGDIDNVYTSLEDTDYYVVYLQDIYSTWYYENDSINELRQEGTYDWQSFLDEDYLPKVEEEVTYLCQTSYSDKVVYCLYNECDNGVWFGTTKTDDDGNVWGDYDEQGAANFFSAWKQTYDLVKSINPDAIIGGPGFCDYNSDEIKAFLSYCVENDCVPEIMIYHELSDYSIRLWQSNVQDYRQIEEELGLSEELPIIVTEYGRMCDNGMPGLMLQYITQIEMSGVMADNAYWRLADNLCDVAADDNSPNSNWWVYRWYTQLGDNRVVSTYNDLFNSNVENAFIKHKEEYTSFGFMGLVGIDEEQTQINVICGGSDGSGEVRLKNLDETSLYNQKVLITIEETVYEGLSGVVTKPTVLKQYTDVLTKNYTVKLSDLDKNNAYHITISLLSDDSDEVDYVSDDYIERFEFEDGTLLGNAYTYNNWYAATNSTSSDENDTVGGMETDGDGVEISFTVPTDGTYDLTIIYGNSNDGAVDEETNTQDADDRVDSVSYFILDGTQEELSFPNTIKSEYSDNISYICTLSAGTHTLKITHKEGTIVLDSLLVKEYDEETANLPYAMVDNDRTNETTQSFLIISQDDGYYNVDFLGGDISTAYINDNEIDLSQSNTVYFCRGLNYLDVTISQSLDIPEISFANDSSNDNIISVNANDMSVLDGATVDFNDTKEIYYINNISCNGGEAEFTVNADESGVYAFTFTCANNDEGGHHDYNVDLIERYVTVSVNGESKDVYCRNTYSWDTYKTVTAYFTLEKGENKISLTNSGDTKFDNQDTYAPYISNISICSLQG